MGKSIEEMKVELLAAGYQFLAEHDDGMSYGTFVGWVQASDDTWIEGESFGYKFSFDAEESRQKADNSCVQKAYAHMLHEREYAAMKARCAEIDSLATKLLEALQARPLDHDAYHAIHTECDFTFWNNQMDRLKKQVL